MFREAGGRLALALTFSALIHVWLAGGVRLRRAQVSETVSLPIEARLESMDLPRSSDSLMPPAPDGAIASPGHPAGSPARRLDRGSAVESAATWSSDTESATESLPDPAQYDPRPPLEAPLLVDATVYAPQELDVIPLPLEALTLPLAHEEAGAGSVTLELLIDEYGNVREGRVVDAEPQEYPADAVLQVFRAVRFSPAQREGRAVRARIAISIDSADREVPRQVNP